ncbi:MAG TPA: methyltransferase domain-containing protein [Propionicimonas sp.]|uniref:class I SAM-dependent methyltransferase n=1 Tax=Propionicimonas sp. TaxID=1955623 RepID=UPI002F406E5C
MPIPHDPRQHNEPAPEDPTRFWERRYAESPQVWSGKVNPALAELADGITPGRALDLGCGEGGDSVWLATQGWDVTAVDISTVAIARGQAAAAAAGIDPERLHWVAADLTGWSPTSDYDLVSACFLQSPVALDRARILRAAASRIVPGGHLLIVSHAAPPPWASGLTGHDHHRVFFTPQQEIEALDAPEGEWEHLIVETRQRTATGPDGQSGLLDDAVVLLRRN